MPRYQQREDYGDASKRSISERREAALQLVLKRQRQQLEAQLQQERLESQRRMEAKAQQLEEQRQVSGYYEKTAPPEFKESVAFYTEIGYPQYAGAYAPFEVPKGYIVSQISPTKEGLQVQFEPIEKPVKGLAQTLAEYEVTPLLDVRKYTPEYLLHRTMPAVTPLAGIAGVIAPSEALLYTVARIAGAKTPEIPPTWTMEYGPEYAAGVLSGQILLSIGISKGVSALTPPITHAVEKMVGYAEKTFAPESYYYYKYILEKPMITTIAQEYAKGTIEAFIGQERYLYMTKIAYPTLIQKTLPTIRSTLIESPLGEAYLYAKAVAYPTFKYVTLPKIAAAGTKIGSQIKGTFIESPFAEPYIYAKGIAYPTFKHSVTTTVGQITSGMKSSVMKSALGEAYLYGKSVAIPKYTTTLKSIPEMLPSLPLDFSGAKSYIQSYITDIKLYVKSYFGKQYILPAPKPYLYPMKTLLQPQKIVDFPTKQISVGKSFLELKEVPSTLSKGINLGIEQVIVPMLVATAQAYPTVMHEWKGMEYPGIKRRQKEIAEETILHYPHQALSVIKIGRILAPSLKQEIGVEQFRELQPKSLLMSASRATVAQELRTSSIQNLQQVQRSMQKVAQQYKTAPFMDIEKLRHRRKRKTEPIFGFYGRYKRQYPIATPSQVVKMIVGNKRK